MPDSTTVPLIKVPSRASRASRDPASPKSPNEEVHRALL